MTSAHPKSSATTLAREGNLSDRIYAELRRRLQRTPLGPDERLFDLDVAATYGTSRMPARDALLRLVNEGYLVGTTRGFVMPVLTAQDVREIFEIRRLLEPSAIANAVAVLTDIQLAAMGAAYRKCRRGADKLDIPLISEANIEFRVTWLEAVPNLRLKAEILRFSDHTQQVRRSTMSKPGTMQIVADGMQLLLAGLTARDPVKVREATISFLDSAERLYFQDSEKSGKS
jgi:DNA-binding GntR family transcriptional regulator